MPTIGKRGRLSVEVTIMGIVLMSEKGQVTIPQDLRKRLKIGKGDPLIAEFDPRGGILLRPAAFFTLESYSEARLEAFLAEDRMTDTQKKKISKRLHA